MAEKIILKLGGSVITDKKGDCKVDKERIRALANEISQRTDVFPIIVHGAGSCGHPEARRHHLDKGLDQTNRAGIFVTHHAVGRLNDAVVNALRDSGVESVGIHPLDACTAKKGRLISFNCETVELLVKNGIVPVLHGDVVMDTEQGACIVSGDQIISYIAGKIKVDRIGLATDVDGVLKDGMVIPSINTESAGELDIKESSNTDVTGGMKGKISELLSLAESGIESSIFHVSRTGDFLDGRDHGGTIVTK
ncbi:isopentenyl phosphate kinase family protein [Methanoplanus sp. FWC-SCC4]|uniref:Isopentenyl phosphate kinase n=1 Tax=Methanochimaera problematica TaxID=2609417 RepID=A0AA97FCN0_9EURY|nr:isopentenyl phosphate kinase [Methanoplanus sp. FWC-SCC4]WOF16509.1 isopentenyl phosphate kinase family protein [Methanoplanus sp. FWC-SCC4]